MFDKGESGAPVVRDLEPFIDLLYEAITDSTKWEPFFKAVAEAFGTTAASLIVTDDGMANGVFSVLHNLDPQRLARAGPSPTIWLWRPYLAAHDGTDDILGISSKWMMWGQSEVDTFSRR